MTYVLDFFYTTASATVYGQKPKFVRPEHSATAKGENCTYWELEMLTFKF